MRLQKDTRRPGLKRASAVSSHLSSGASPRPPRKCAPSLFAHSILEISTATTRLPFDCSLSSPFIVYLYHLYWDFTSKLVQRGNQLQERQLLQERRTSFRVKHNNRFILAPSESSRSSAVSGVATSICVGAKIFPPSLSSSFLLVLVETERRSETVKLAPA